MTEANPDIAGDWESAQGAMQLQTGVCTWEERFGCGRKMKSTKPASVCPTPWVAFNSIDDETYSQGEGYMLLPEPSDRGDLIKL